MLQQLTIKLRLFASGLALIAFIIVSSVVMFGAANAQGISKNPVTIMVPFSAGSGLDTMARLIGQELSKKWNQNIVIKNKPGASGKIGTALVAKAKPDGHTILFTATSYVLNAVLSKDLPYSVNDFTAITEVARATFSLAVHPSFPAKNMKEFVTYVKANPGKVDFASPGLGTPHYLAMELFKGNEGLNMAHIPYKGQSRAVTDIIGGQVKVMLFPTHIALPLAKSGKIRMLAVFADKRVAIAPELPTMKEEGYPINLDVWYGFLAPAKTPKDIVQKFNTSMNEILKMPEVNNNLTKRSLAVTGGTTKELNDLINNQMVKWSKVVKDAGIEKR